MTEVINVLSDHVRDQIDRALAKFPSDQKQSAVLTALTAAQHENDGYLTRPIMDSVADYLGMSRIAVYEVATFYSMLQTRPVGRHCIAVCTNISCMLRGSDAIVEHIERRLGVKLGESTSDGRFFLKNEEECLAGCCGAPMMQIDHKYYENLTPERVDEILDRFEKEVIPDRQVRTTENTERTE